MKLKEILETPSPVVLWISKCFNIEPKNLGCVNVGSDYAKYECFSHKDITHIGIDKESIYVEYHNGISLVGQNLGTDSQRYHEFEEKEISKKK